MSHSWFVVRDVATTFGIVLPSRSKDTEETARALQNFIGDTRVNRLHSDIADERCDAARFLIFPLKHHTRLCRGP